MGIMVTVAACWAGSVYKLRHLRHRPCEPGAPPLRVLVIALAVLGVAILFRANAIATSPDTAQKVQRQPKVVPMAVPIGTPMILATVNPARISPVAVPRLSRGASEVAITIAAPK